MMRWLKQPFLIISALFLFVVQSYAYTRTDKPAIKSVLRLPEVIQTGDSLDRDLDKIPDLRTLFERENKTYSLPFDLPSGQRREMGNRPLRMSPEALYWARKKMDPGEYFSPFLTFRDTVIVDPLFLPLVFKKDLYKDQWNFRKSYELFKREPLTFYEVDTTLFQKEMVRQDIRRKAYEHIIKKHPEYISYTESDFPKDRLVTDFIRKEVFEDIPIRIKPDIRPDEYTPPAKFIPDRLYWTSQFESAVQFSQNYVSPNWHKGGSSNLNLYTKNYLKYDYNKDKVQITNEFEDKISLYNASKDTLHNYRIGEDVFRIHSNVGYRAFSKWYYTVDGEFKTQLLRSYEENKDNRIAAFLAPFTINLGIGMKYDLNKTFEKKGKNLQLAVNLAPVSFTYMYSIDKTIDGGKHGFQKISEDPVEYDFSLSQFGSTIKADMIMNFSPTVSWQSRIYYFTTYEKVVGEFENTLVLAINRFFSTRIYFHLRFDDSTTKNEDFNSYFQLNELLSFGFNYKW